MFRVYFVKKTEYGLVVEGPNGHKWQCKPDETWSRATGFAKTLERAYFEGQKSITHDVGLTVALNALADLGADAARSSAEAVKTQVMDLAEKAQKAVKKLDKIRSLTQKDEIYDADELSTVQTDHAR